MQSIGCINDILSRSSSRGSNADIGNLNRILLNKRIVFLKTFCEVAIHQNLDHSSTELHQWIGPVGISANIGMW